MEKHGLPAVYNALMSGFGEEIGSGDIRFIQDIGQKLEGTPYLDKNTNKLYLCVSTTNSTNNDSSFMRFDMKEAFAKLNNLINIEGKSGYNLEIRVGAVSLYKDEKEFYFTTPFTTGCIFFCFLDLGSVYSSQKTVSFNSTTREYFKASSTMDADHVRYIAFGY